MKDEKEINQIALDLLNDKIFTDRQVQSQKDLPHVFIPLAFGALSDMPEEEVKNIGMIYEYMDKAGPRSVNGYPMFMSMRYVTKEELERVAKKYKTIKAAIDEAMKVDNLTSNDGGNR